MSKLLSYFKTLLESFLSSKAEWITSQTKHASSYQEFETGSASDWNYTVTAPANGTFVLWVMGATSIYFAGDKPNGYTFTVGEWESATGNKSIQIKAAKGEVIQVYWSGDASTNKRLLFYPDVGAS